MKCGRRKQLRKRYDLFIDECLSMKERKKRYEMVGKVKELRRELKSRIGDIEVDLEYEIEKVKVKIGRNWYDWKNERWVKLEK